MDSQEDILHLLTRVAGGALRPEEALGQLRFLPVSRTLEGVAVDHHRRLRTGCGETVFAQGKSLPVLVAAVRALENGNGTPVLATRVAPEQGAALLEAFPQGEFWEDAGLFCVHASLQLTPPWPCRGEVVVVSAGASDLRVALEALGTLRFQGISAALASDIGVAGLHRLAPWLEVFDAARVLIVVAGMEGALPSVLAGMTRRPVVAVPVSNGYGVSSGGFAALFSMLASCAPGMGVCNIDNGYGAAMLAARILSSARD